MSVFFLLTKDTSMFTVLASVASLTLLNLFAITAT